MKQKKQATQPSNLSPKVGGTQVSRAGALYEVLTKTREQYLTMGKRLADLTLPYICPPNEGHAVNNKKAFSRNELAVPQNGTGAQGVKNLASKIVITLFPVSVPFFRFLINEAVLDEADDLEQELGEGQQEGPNGEIVQAAGSMRQEIQKKLLSMEKILTNRTDRKAHRKIIYEAIKKLIVTGNVLIRFLEDGKLRTHNLGNYVVERDYSGEPYRIILKEMKTVSLLPDELRQRVLEADPSLKNDPDAECELYTYYGKQEQGKLWETWQEVSNGGFFVPDSFGTYTYAKLPVLALRWIAIDDEDYGRGLCEEHIADLEDLEQLSQDVKEVSKACAKVIPLVNPNGVTDPMDLANAQNLEFCDGVDSDITIVGMMDKTNDYQAANSMRQEIKERLQEVFLMYQSAQRDAERVTAEEIRYIAGQLEQAHGGVYTVLADEFQRPYVDKMVEQALNEGDLDRDLFADGQIRPEVVTGMDAIGRGQDSQSLQVVFGMLQQFPELQTEINLVELMTRSFLAEGIELDGLLKTPAQKLAEQQQAQAQQQGAMQDEAGMQMQMAEHQASLEQPQQPPA